MSAAASDAATVRRRLRRLIWTMKMPALGGLWAFFGQGTYVRNPDVLAAREPPAAMVADRGGCGLVGQPETP